MTNETFGGNGTEAGLFEKTETIDTSKNVHARSFWETVGEAATKAIKTIAEAPRSKGVYASTFTYGIPEIADGYVTDTTLHEDYITSAPASQSWLRKVTGKNQYVAGAAVLDGEDEGTYIDSTLVEGAKRFIVSYTNEDFSEAGKYAVHFVEAVKTEKHEDAHYRLGILSEDAAEGHAGREVAKLAGIDGAVSFAVKHYSLAA